MEEVQFDLVTDDNQVLIWPSASLIEAHIFIKISGFIEVPCR